MKHKKIYISSLILIIAAAAVIGFTFTQTSQAAAVSGSSQTQTALSVKHTAKTKLTGKIKLAGKTKPTSAQIAVMKTKQQAIVAALDANNYNAWLTAVGTSSPLLTKINATNFSQYDQAYQLRKQAGAIITSLGIQKVQNNGIIGAWGR
jgi:hypothetical protein